MCGPDVKIREVNVADLAKLHAREDLQLLDVRGLDFFLGYIPGARRAPFELIKQELTGLVSELGETGQTIVFICKNGGGFSRGYAAEFMKQAMAVCAKPACHVCVLRGGFSAWEAEFASHENAARFIRRAPYFPGAPHAPLALRAAAAQSCGTLGKGLVVPRAAPVPDASDASQLPATMPAGSASPATSGTLEEERRTAGTASDEEGDQGLAPAVESWRAGLAVGSVLWVRPVQDGQWFQGCITACNKDIVKVSYVEKGRCRVQNVNRNSMDLRNDSVEA